MTRFTSVSLLALAALCTCALTASAQDAAAPADTFYPARLAGDSVAYIYVSSSPSSTTSLISGFSAGPAGRLTPIPGSPFTTQGDGALFLALNGAWLFGTNINSDIYSFSIAEDGALRQVDSYDAGHVIPSVVEEGPEGLFLDHTGATLYVPYLNIPENCGNPGYEAYSINQSNGELTFVNDVCFFPPAVGGGTMSFVASNQFAYTSGCYDFSPTILGIERSSSGAITLLNNSSPMPPPTSGGGYYLPCAGGAAADPANNFALAVQPWAQDIVPTAAGPYQIATYTVDSDGNVSTNSTPDNMPQVAVGNVTTYWMSPDGRYLAVGGQGGLQVLHWNGANPATSFTGLLTTDAISQVYWDDEHHLYAVSDSAGKLHVFLVSAFGATEAPGSPYSIPGAANLIVLPRQALAARLPQALMQGWH